MLQLILSFNLFSVSPRQFAQKVQKMTGVGIGHLWKTLPFSTGNSCCACFISGCRKHIQFPITGTHFASAPAPNTGKAPLPPHTPGMGADLTHPSSKKAKGAILVSRAGHCPVHQPLSLHQLCLSPSVKSYLHVGWRYEAFSSMPVQLSVDSLC